MSKIAIWWARLLAFLFLCACILIFALMSLICLDVLLRNVPLIPGSRGIAWGNEVSESMLYLMTMLAAPWLLYKGQQIRVDIVLRTLAPQAAWYCELVADLLALGCSVVIAVYGFQAAYASYASGALTIKTLVTPEYWLLIPLPVTFTLLSVEVLFRIQRLYAGPRQVRDEAVTSG